jgi:hypothetical protein
MPIFGLSSAATPVANGLNLFGDDVLQHPSKIFKFIKEDHGLPDQKKKSLMHMLNSPEAFDQLLAGAAGAAIAHTAASYSKISRPGRLLLSLAGFGLGNIMYSTLQERKFTDYDPKTGISTVKKY